MAWILLHPVLESTRDIALEIQPFFDPEYRCSRDSHIVWHQGNCAPAQIPRRGVRCVSE